MPLWVPVTMAAALFQVWRTALQQRLRAELAVSGASFVRYVFALPADLLLLGGYLLVTRQGLPVPGLHFVLAAAGGGLLQIVATVLLILSFGYRNFTVGTAYAKTETIQMALFAWIVLGEALKPVEWLGIGLAASGVIALSLAGQGASLAAMLRASRHPAALSGLGAGFCFAWTAIFIKSASDSLGTGEPVLRALATLLVMNAMQTVMQGGWMAVRERAQLLAAIRAWQRAGWVGLLSAAGSACWFTGFTLAPVALVRTLGQVEIPLLLVFSHFLLHERVRRVEITGLLLVMAGAMLVVAMS
ncbi:MAG: DMT family transporter [Rhodospirillales bacterium]|nr:DMT family transporter [Rhodospirillales bacterium]